MSFEREIAERLRGARVRVDVPPPPFAGVRARIEEARAGEERSRRGTWHGRVPLLVVLGALAIAGSAWGADALLFGSRVTPVGGPVRSNEGIGSPLDRTTAVLGLRVPDPAGGLPWGMRIIRTTRQQACLQVGRVLDHSIGAIGVGYAFHADGRFHPFSAEVALTYKNSCVQVDEHGNVFTVQGPLTASSDGLSLAENTFTRVHCDLPGQHNWGFRCPLADLRLIAFGVLGPDAKTLTAAFDGRSFNVTPYGPQGAYLLVLPAPNGTNVGYFGSQAPNPPKLTVAFRDGARCPLPEMNDTDACKPQGITYSRAPDLTSGQLAGAVHLTYRHRVPAGMSPLTNTGPNSQRAVPESHATPGLQITFNAPLAIPNPLSTYAVEIHRPVVKGCYGGDTLLSQQPSPTLRRGQSTSIIVPIPVGCHGHYSGRVFYFAAGQSRKREAGELAMRNEIFAEAFEHRPHSSPGITVGRFDIDIPAGQTPDRPVESVRR